MLNMNDESIVFDPASDEAHQFLQEVRRATRGTCQTEIFEFSGMLLQLIDFLEDCGCDPLLPFVVDGMDALKSVIASDQTNSKRMDSLREKAIERWGECLSFDSDDYAAEIGDPEQWSGDAGKHEVEEAGLVTPSVDEISDLLGQLGQIVPLPEDEPIQDGASRRFPFEHKQDPAASNLFCRADPDKETVGQASLPAGAVSCSASIQALDNELREAFMDDASGCLKALEVALLSLDANESDEDALNQICRELHTLKGASASVGIHALADHLHGLEDVLRENQTAGCAPNVDELLQSVDWIREQLAFEAGGLEALSEPPVSTSKNTEPFFTAIPVSSPFDSTASSTNMFTEERVDTETVRVKSSQLNRLMDMLAELVMLRNRRETELNDLQEVYHELIGTVSKMRLLSHDDCRTELDTSALQLSEVANDVLEIAQHVRDCARPVAEGNESVSQFIRQFRQELVELRRTPVSGLFQRLHRVVRDAAQVESKEVQLQLLGENAGIERSLQQRLYEPLMHIVRNAVCHGIESPETRVRQGKSASGTITLEAKSGPDLFVIEVRDDGGGLDYDAIRRRGVERGLIAAHQSVSHRELSQLILHPGFSTRVTTSQIAGRGVGMDVVASTLQRMRGWLEVDSEPQQGTRIRLSFPLPSVIQHAMVFRSGEQLFALPMHSVQNTGGSNPTSNCVMFSDLMGTACEKNADCCQRIVLACESPASTGGQSMSRITLLVDEVVGPEEVVVRPLPTMLKQHPFCSGATLSGMGQTVLVLDAHRVVESQFHLSGAASMLPVEGRSESGNEPQSRPRVLVVDDSLSARKRVVRSFERYAVEIVEASDGKQALEAMGKQRFAAVFSDLEMPHVNGMQLLAEVNSQESYEPPPIVIISSRNEEALMKEATEMGAHRYLSKPISDDALDQAIHDIPLLRRLQDQSSAAIQTQGDHS